MTKRMVRSALATVCAVVVALAVSAVAHVGVAHAATSAVYTAATVPSYSNPVTGSIEDSAGQSNIALAESMTTGCTYPAALVETDTAGNTFVTLRFKLADQMGAMTFWADNAGDGAFAEVEATQMQTSTVGDTAVADWRFQVPSETSNIRVSMYVNPMSRAVVYFVQLADLAEGNTDALPFVESVVPGEEAVEQTQATQAETAPAADAAASATSEAAPSTDSGANSGVKEYNADGQETTEGSQS
ncbi:heme-binding Shp domain-containing protein, partial [uncultured Senegalimassilia sp.]|uniref:heme-binding Shp domain-containing protein n=1 Tax=uncultured Senegalimassilia sp. TaxID=1714350 RepID=UPI002624AF4D